MKTTVSSRVGIKSLLLFGLFVLWSCETNVIEAAKVSDTKIERTAQQTSDYIPYADIEDLSAFKSDSKVIDYQLSRKLALLELEAAQFRKEFGWEGYEISERPVLIYGQDSRPKYYEFVMLDAEKKPSGTVKTFAQKVSDGVLTEVIGGVRDYQAIVSKSSDGMKFFEGAGGKILVGLPNKSGGQPTTLLDTETGEAVAPSKELTDEEKLELLEGMVEAEAKQSKEVLDTISDPVAKERLQANDTISTEKQIADLNNSMDKAHGNRDDYWNEVGDFEDKLLALSDDDITSKSTKFWGWVSSFFSRLFSPTVEEYQIWKYRYASDNASYSTGIRKGIGTKYCAQFALSWMYRAKYNRYTDKYSSFDKWASTFGGFNFVYQATAIFGRISGTRPMTPTEMTIAYGIATNWRSYITTYPNFGRDNAHDHIKYRNDPIIILKALGGELHWVVGWKSKREKNWYFWDKHWFTVNDNGSFGKESNSYSEKYTRERYRRTYKASWPFVFLKVYE